MQHENQITTKRAITAILISWLLFIGVDFLFHASIFAQVWKEDTPAIKPLTNLALLIPAGYFSFLLLTGLIGYLYFKIFRTKPLKKEVLKFGLAFGLLFSLSNLLGLFSYVAIPFEQLLLFNLVYFIEIIVVTGCMHYISYSTNLKKSLWFSILIFISLLISGIVIQNMFSHM